MKSTLHAPLVHFFLLGAAVFGLFAIFDDAPTDMPSSAIEVTDAQVDRMAMEFEATWRRPPEPAELDALIDRFVKEEVYVREAIALGLDQDDAVIRRRLQMKMEFLTEATRAADPDDTVLQAHLDANADRFALAPVIAFEQIMLGEGMGDEVLATTRAQLNEGERPEAIGRPSLLPATLPASPQRVIDSTFGTGFFEAIWNLPVGEWSGPVPSPYGRHLVRVAERKEARLPRLPDIRDAVEEDWRADLSRRLRQERFEAMLDRYRVIRPDIAGAGE